MAEPFEAHARVVVVEQDFGDGDLLLISGIDGRAHLAYEYGGRTGSLWRVVGDTKAGAQAKVVPFDPPPHRFELRYVYVITPPGPGTVTIAAFSSLEGAKVMGRSATKGESWEQLDDNNWIFTDSNGVPVARVVRYELHR